jgi:hypothetical protein
MRDYSDSILILDYLYRRRIAEGVHIGMMNREHSILKFRVEVVLDGHYLQAQDFRIFCREMARMSLGVFMIIQGGDDAFSYGLPVWVIPQHAAHKPVFDYFRRPPDGIFAIPQEGWMILRNYYLPDRG